MAQHLMHGRNLGLSVLLRASYVPLLVHVRGERMTQEEKEMNEILKHLARSINFEKIEEFYSDPKNREAFEDWKRKKATSSKR